MSLQDSYREIRPVLQKRATKKLAKTACVRQDIQPQLQQILEIDELAVVSGEANCLEALLADWVAACANDRGEDDQSISVLLKQLLKLSFDTAREILKADEALELTTALMPVYLHSLEQVLANEHQKQVADLSRELQSQQKKIERLDQSKSNFVSVAAHEFKPPLTLIEGYAAILSESLPPESDQLYLLIQGIHNGTRRLRELVDDMVDLSMLENHLLALTFQPVWLNRSMNLLKADFQEIVKRRRQTLEIHPFPETEELIFADPERLYQALKNLLSNAIKYTPDGGKIVVEGRLISGFIEMTVTDNGIGISPENLSTIFEKFGQLGDASRHSSGKTKFKGGGPGLGLPITKGIIEAHGGTIWVESAGYDEENCPGTTFHILLPARSQPNDPQLAKLFGALAEADSQKTEIDKR